jgi:hypothetical protein
MRAESVDEVGHKQRASFASASAVLPVVVIKGPGSRGLRRVGSIFASALRWRRACARVLVQGGYDVVGNRECAPIWESRDRGT